MSTTAEKIKVMQAFEDGKAVEGKVCIAGQPWVNLCEEPMWDWRTQDYRLKPQPKYRPFETIEEVEAVFGKVAREGGKGSICISSCRFDRTGCLRIHGIHACVFLERFTIDGHPAGVEVKDETN